LLTRTIIEILFVLLDVVWWIIFVQFILSLLITFNVINTGSDLVRSVWNALERVTEPMYRPIRRVVPIMGGIDWSPLIVLILIRILNIVLSNILVSTYTGQM
jgi:YggT family protein